jgi:DNA-binding response OmpR family regulator
MSEMQRQVIVVVEDQGLLSVLHEQFHDERYELVFARTADEATTACEALGPRLVVTPIATLRGDAEPWARARRGGTFILAVARTREERDEARERQAVLDWVVLSTDTESLCQAAREVLGDRRLVPRVDLRFSVTIAGGMEATVRQVSVNAIEVETEAELQVGKATKVQVQLGPASHEFMCLVIKVEPSVFYGRSTAVLLVHFQETRGRKLLGDLAHLAVQLKRLLVEPKGSDLRLRGRDAWLLMRRAETVLRGTGGVRVGDSGSLFLDTRAIFDALDIDRAPVDERYVIDRVIGTWGVGAVSLARHRLLGRQVLLKTLLPNLIHDAPARRQLEHEAGFTSPTGKYVPEVVDFDGDYYAMEPLSGGTLADALSGGLVLAPFETAALGLHLVAALSPLHGHGLGHYDLCPQNIVLHRPGATTVRPVLTGFAAPEDWGDPARSRLVGARYRPPDGAGRGPSRDFDVYAVARILLEVLASSRRLRTTEATEPPPGEQRLLDVVEKGTATRRVDRFGDIDELEAALRGAFDALGPETLDDSARLIDPLPHDSWISEHPTPVTNAPVPFEEDDEPGDDLI